MKNVPSGDLVIEIYLGKRRTTDKLINLTVIPFLNHASNGRDSLNLKRGNKNEKYTTPDAAVLQELKRTHQRIFKICEQNNMPRSYWLFIRVKQKRMAIQ